jgi:diaminohydroxyphosphoribosylaminopyrimidine deaminase/5-amino-6-(5-phosphoribosylamino)uracil reductase
VSPEFDEQMMRRAIRLAMNGRGSTEPNPSVGCVLVKDGRVIGEGHTQPFGGSHAEPTALASCTESPEGATAYVTLEPCCHTNKKTPPCTPRLIEAKVARVVYGCLDPNPPVNGKGVAMLRAAGIRVDGPVLEGAAKQVIAPFIAKLLSHRTYVTLKWAQTANGKVAGRDGERLQISGAQSMRLVHRLRGASDVIMVGIGTVLTDDPMLTSRGDQPAPREQIRAVLDRQLRIWLDARVVATAAEHQTLLFCAKESFEHHREKVRALEARHVSVIQSPQNRDETLSLSDLRTSLSWTGMRAGAFAQNTHLLVEPGPTLARAFLKDGLADRVWVFAAPHRLDDDRAPEAHPVPGHYVRTGTLQVGEDTLTEYLNPQSDAFFAAEPSADFVLAAESIQAAPAVP